MECEWVRFREFRHGNIAGAAMWALAQTQLLRKTVRYITYLEAQPRRVWLINLCCRLILVLYSCLIDHQMTGWVMARICT